MSDWIYLVIAALGLLLVGAGGGGLLMKRKKGSKTPPVLPPAPLPHIPVGPSPKQVDEADEGAKETDVKVAEIEKRQTELDKTEPNPVAPTDAGVTFLRNRDKEKL